MKKTSTLVATAIIFFISTLLTFAQEVSPSGSFSYTYPIKLPPGTNGMAPNLALVYDSSAGNGILGMGWSIAGLDVIERDPSYPINFNVNDHYIYNGQKLIHDRDLDYYHLEKENYTIIKAIGDVHGGSGYWVVLLQDGTRRYFGETWDSLVNAVGQPQPKTRLWALNRVIDPNGNYYTISYTEDENTGDYYPHVISYTHTQPDDLQAHRSVEFRYGTRDDHFVQYLPTSVDVLKRLTGIDIRIDGGLLRKYELAYDSSPSTGRSRLTSIQEFGSDGTALGDPTRFIWQEGAASVSEKHGWGGGFGASLAYQTGTADFNGDGKAEFWQLGKSGCTFYVWTSDGSDQATWRTWGADFRPADDYETGTADFNGDGMADVWQLAKKTGMSASFYVWLSNGQDFLPHGNPWGYGFGLACDYQTCTADFNGDGRADVYQLAKKTLMSTSFYVWLSNGQDFLPHGNPWGDSFGLACDYQTCAADFNGDGRADVWQLSRAGTIASFKVWLSNGQDFLPHGNPWGNGFGLACDYQTCTADFNGDGRDDVWQFTASDNLPPKFYVWISHGSGFNTYQEWGSSFGIPSNYMTQTADFNGDGRADVWQLARKAGQGLQLYVWFSKGSGLDGHRSWGSDFFLADEYQTETADINGDGKADLWQLPYSLNHSFVYDWKTDDRILDVIKKVEMPSGGFMGIEYRPSASLSGTINHNTSVYPRIADISPRALVIGTTQNDGMGSESTFSYHFCDGKKVAGFPYERTSLGFASFKSTDPTGAYTISKYDQSDRYHAGLINAVENWGQDGHLYRSVELQYGHQVEKVAKNDNAKSLSCMAISISREIDRIFPMGDSAFLENRTVYAAPDAFGNPTSIEYSGDYVISGDESKTTYSYTNPPAWPYEPYIIKPTSIVKESCNLDGEMGIESVQQFFYDDSSTLGAITKGLITKQIIENGTNDIILTFGYDAYGNLIWIKDARVNSGEYAGYTTQITYDPNYETLPLTKTDALGYVTTMAYDPLMRPTSVTDANGILWTTEYDVFGRVTAEIKPGDTSGSPTKKIVYNDTASLPPSPRSVAVGLKDSFPSTDGYLWTYTYYDGLGREIQTKSESDEVNGEGETLNFITIDRYYDEVGRNCMTSVPYITTDSGYTERDVNQKCKWTEYDEIGREKKIHNTDTTERSTVYTLHDVISIDENGHVTARTINGNEVTDHTYWGEFTYDTVKAGFNVESDYSTTTTKTAFNGTKITDEQNNVIRTTLDMAGRKLRYVDPDMGTWEYDYDPNGNLIWQKDAKNQEITFTYDKLNRPLTKHYGKTPVEEIRYYYDETTDHGESTGRLTRVTRYDGSTEHPEQFLAYDARGRITFIQKTINGESRVMERTYDSLDRMVSEVYPQPVGETVTYAYKNSGRLEKVSGLNGGVPYDYVTGIEYTPLGKVSDMGYGNNVYTRYDYYDSAMEQDGSSGMHYSYRLKNISLTRGLSTIASLDFQYDKKDNVTQKYFVDDTPLTFTEDFTYDSLDRLIGAACDEIAGYGSKSYVYDALNNIEWKDERNYQYGTTYGPHAVVNDGTYTYTYDANGNTATRSDGRAYTYDFDNRVTSITNGGTYAYDASGQRSMKVENGITTYYFFPQYEEEVQSGQPVIKRIQYYFANGTRVAQKSNTAEGLLYYHADHLGSAMRMIDGDGDVVQTLVYDPFGTTIYSDGASGNSYMYTGQEKDQATGLYYYGARYYDPVLGKFITPDTVLDGLNRYAYCHNNPVKYVDPTGQKVVDKDYEWLGTEDNPYEIPEYTESCGGSGDGIMGYEAVPVFEYGISAGPSHIDYIPIYGWSSSEPTTSEKLSDKIFSGNSNSGSETLDSSNNTVESKPISIQEQIQKTSLGVPEHQSVMKYPTPNINRRLLVGPKPPIDFGFTLLLGLGVMGGCVTGWDAGVGLAFSASSSKGMQAGWYRYIGGGVYFGAGFSASLDITVAPYPSIDYIKGNSTIIGASYGPGIPTGFGASTGFSNSTGYPSLTGSWVFLSGGSIFSAYVFENISYANVFWQN